MTAAIDEVWAVAPDIVARPLGTSVLVYHEGAGDTHVLGPFAGSLLLSLLSAEIGQRWSPAAIAALPQLADVAPGVWQGTLHELAEAGIVQIAAAA